MADRIKGITVEIGGDTTGLSKALSGVNKEIRNTQSQLTDVNRLLKLDPTNPELLSKKQKLLSQAVGETKEKLTQLKSVQDQMDAGLKNGSVTQEQYDAWQREIIATEQELKGLEQQCKKTDTSVSATLKQAGSKMQEVGGKISEVGEGLTTHVTAPIVAVGAASLAAFSEVDSGLDIVEQKTGATGQTLEDMNQTVKDLATEIPTDFETAGAAVGEVNTRFGLTGQALDDLSGKFIKFADLNNTDVSTSVDNVSGVLNAFGQDASNAGDLLDAMNATGQATGIDMDTLASALQTNAVQLKELGLNSQQAAGFMGMVEMSGLDTSAAMMGLKTAMKNATKAGKTLDQAIAGFSTTMKGNGSETEKLQAAYDLFGSKAGAAIYNACATGKLNLDNLSGSLGNFSGSVENTFNETLDPIDQFKMTMNSLKETGAEIGNSLATVLAPVLKDISAALKGFAEMWSKIPAPVQETIVKIALAAAAIGPILVVVGKIISAVGTIMTIIPQVSAAIGVVKGAMTALNATMLANPIVLIIAAIAALVAAFLYLWNTNEGFRQFWIDLWENVKQVAITVCNAIKAFFQQVWDAIKLIFTTVFGIIKTLVTTYFNLYKTIITTVFNTIKTIFTTYFNIYKTIIQTVLTIIQTVITTVWNTIKTVITTVLTAIQTIFTTVWNAIKTIVQAVVSGIKGLITGDFTAVKNSITTIMNTIKSTISTIWNTIKSTVSTVLNAIKSAVSGVFNGIVNAVKGAMTNVLNAAKSGFSNVKNHITGLASQAFTWGKDLVMGIVNGIKSCIGAVGDAVKGVADKIKSFLHFSVPDEGPLTDYESWMPDFMGGLAKGIEKSNGLVADAVEGVASDMVVNPNITPGAIQTTQTAQTNALSGIMTDIQNVLGSIDQLQMTGGGDISIPVYIGGTLLDEVVVNAQTRQNLRSGGR